MRQYPILNKTIIIFLFVLPSCILGFASGKHTYAMETTSSSGEEFVYAKIISAKIVNGLHKSLHELEILARENGTEEVIMFTPSDGPEKQKDRWRLRSGSKKYAYPGFTARVRTHLSEVKERNTLKVSEDGKNATEVFTKEKARLQWTFPDSVQSPLSCTIFQNGEVVSVNTFYERHSPSGKQQWPEVIRIDLPQKDMSIIQLFEYLDKRPDGLSSVHRKKALELPGETIFAKPSHSDTIKSLSALPGYDPLFVSFSTSWGAGIGFDYDTGWQPPGVPIQVRLDMGAGGDITSLIRGDFQLDKTNEILCAGSATGELGIDFGVEMEALGRVDIDLGWYSGYFEFEIPYAPNFDLRCEGTTLFDSYLLDPSSPAIVGDSIDPLQLFSVSIAGVPYVADVSATMNAGMSLAAQMEASEIKTDESTHFYNEGDCNVVVLNQNGEYEEEADYLEDLNVDLIVTFSPDVDVEINVYFYSWEASLTDYVPSLEFNWDVLAGYAIDLDFPRSPFIGCDQFGDPDEDGIFGDEEHDNQCDNCFLTPNGPGSGTCSKGTNVGGLCTMPGGNEGECGVGGFCSMDQEDYDLDGLGDVCDNCPDDYNPGQEDGDSDGIADACDNCPNDYNPDQEDGDSDGIADACDNCPDIPNGPLLGTCLDCPSGEIGGTCESDDGCSSVESCAMNQEDICIPLDDGDDDGVIDACDNCPSIPNGTNLGTCYSWSGMESGTTCLSDLDCGGSPGSCSMNQEDNYPPDGNGMGDACECEGDFNCDGNVDAFDVTAFIADFGRSRYNNPCTLGDCNGDFNCDRNVDAFDVVKFLEDFGRSSFNDPCPLCNNMQQYWCVYIDPCSDNFVECYNDEYLEDCCSRCCCKTVWETIGECTPPELCTAIGGECNPW